MGYNFDITKKYNWYDIMEQPLGMIDKKLDTWRIYMEITITKYNEMVLSENSAPRFQWVRIIFSIIWPLKGTM